MKLSIVVPVGPEFSHLEAQLRALAGQDLHGVNGADSAGGVELVLSCNGAAPAAVEQLARRKFCASDWQLTVIDSSAVRGPSHARNAGWHAASGALVLFCDADDVVDAGWVAGLVSALRTADVVGGRFEYERLNPDGVGAWGAIGTDALPTKFRHLPFVPSGNLGVHREVLVDLEGFDETLDRSEDVDFAWRAAYAGKSVQLAPNALLHVRRRATLTSLFAQAREDASFDVPLIARHRIHGAKWTIRDLLREGAGAVVALIQAPFGVGHRAKLATRSGRLLGHVVVAPRMLRRR